MLPTATPEAEAEGSPGERSEGEEVGGDRAWQGTGGRGAPRSVRSARQAGGALWGPLLSVTTIWRTLHHCLNTREWQTPREGALTPP